MSYPRQSRIAGCSSMYRRVTSAAVGPGDRASPTCGSGPPILVGAMNVAGASPAPSEAARSLRPASCDELSPGRHGGYIEPRQGREAPVSPRRRADGDGSRAEGAANRGHAASTPEADAVPGVQPPPGEPLPPRAPGRPAAPPLQPPPGPIDADAVPRDELPLRAVHRGGPDLPVPGLPAGVRDPREPRDPPLRAAPGAQRPGALRPAPGRLDRPLGRRPGLRGPPDPPGARGRAGRDVKGRRNSGAYAPRPPRNRSSRRSSVVAARRAARDRRSTPSSNRSTCDQELPPRDRRRSGSSRGVGHRKPVPAISGNAAESSRGRGARVAAARATSHRPTRPWAARNGTPARTKASASSTEPAGSGARNRAERTMPSSTSRTPIPRSTPSINSGFPTWRSRWYPAGSPLRRVRWLTRRPTAGDASARASSARSGFRLCGMSELVVTNVSSRWTRPTSGIEPRTSSSARAEAWVPRRARSNRVSAAESRSDTESRELSEGAENPRRRAVRRRSIGRELPARAPLPSGDRSARRRVVANRSASRTNRRAWVPRICAQ